MKAFKLIHHIKRIDWADTDKYYILGITYDKDVAEYFVKRGYEKLEKIKGIPFEDYIYEEIDLFVDKKSVDDIFKK